MEIKANTEIILYLHAYILKDLQSATPRLIIMKSLHLLRASKIFIRKKLDHTAVSAIKASSVTILTWQKEQMENTVYLQFLT